MGKILFEVCFFVASVWCGVVISPDFPLKKIIGEGLVKSGIWEYASEPANSPLNERYYFYTNVSPGDSVSVIDENIGEGYKEYAYIIHNLNSDSHATFSDENIRRWRNERVNEVSMRDTAVNGVRDIDLVLSEKFRGFWVYVYKYKGEYYLHQDWATLIARELTDTTWVQIDMEVTARGIIMLKGDEECFCLKEVTGDEITFNRIDARREIYQVENGLYMIPARRIHDFKLIGYCGNTGDCIDAFVKFDR